MEKETEDKIFKLYKKEFWDNYKGNPEDLEPLRNSLEFEAYALDYTLKEICREFINSIKRHLKSIFK